MRFLKVLGIPLGICCIVLVPFCRASAQSAQGSLQLMAVPPTLRVRPSDEVTGAGAIDIACARGETESGQIVISAIGGHLERVDATVSELVNQDGTPIPAQSVVLFREHFVPVRHSAPRAAQAPGWVPDPLVPLINPYTGEPVGRPVWSGNALQGPRFGGGGFDVWQDQNQPLWLDVSVPRDQPAGEYTGKLTVTARDASSAEMPIRVTVWDFVLPAGPAHENHFGGFERVARYMRLDAKSGEFHRIEDRYIEMMAAHRLNPPLPRRLYPEVGEDGTPAFDDALDKRISDFVARYNMTDFQIPRAPFGDPTGENRDKAIRFYRGWYAYLADKGWAGRAYLYMLDEPNDSGAYERVRQLGALVQEAEPGIRRLVVEQPYTHKPEWGTLDGSIDIWCPLFGFVHEPSIERVQAQGDDVWSYTALVQTAPPYHPEYEKVRGDEPPFWELDFPVVSYRIAPWLNRRYGITGLLYWSAVYWASPERDPWMDPGFRVRWNGEGALFYPGDAAGIEGPIASLRLKTLRDGMEDYEYFVLLEELGGAGTVEAIVREAVPTWGSWNQDPDCLPRLRSQLAAEILKRQKDG